MTRGQESLVMDLEVPPAELAAADRRARAALRVVRAAPQELVDHQRVMLEIDRESKNGCLWLTQEVALP
jgi:hypothetical protein